MKSYISNDPSYFSLLTDFDIHLFKSGKHFHLHHKLGAHVIKVNKEQGTFFSVWAPNAESVSVIGNFNNWQSHNYDLNRRWDVSGIWERFFPAVQVGELYKFVIRTKSGECVEKSDPFSFYTEQAPKTASIIWDLDYAWSDEKWMNQRKEKENQPKPYAIYEVHLGSWRRKIEEGNRSLTYRELAESLTQYVSDAGFTHVELMPVMEHPFYGSWGYQVTGYYAPTARYGSPQDFKYLIDCLHQANIGVILDWVPSHFPGDAYGLFQFDGTHLYEHADPKKGFHPDWSSYVFDYSRHEVRSFLISNAFYWLEEYHIDGLRVDAVASMLYLDYSRKQGEWEPNIHGGNENMDAINFLEEFNTQVYGHFPDVITIAEESTAWPGVSRPIYDGGLGFGQKWMMGWMHDTLNYFKKDPVYRRHHQGDITFSLVYAFTENFMLPLSHDEVVHGKGSLLSRMPGDEWQKFANLRLLYSYMYTHPGTKLLFMGGEFAQHKEWNHEQSLDWHLIQPSSYHHGVFMLIRALNLLYKSEPALFYFSFHQKGFDWIDHTNQTNSVIIYLRKDEHKKNTLLVICNMTPEVHHAYRVGTPIQGMWKEIFNSDQIQFSGSGVGNPEPIPSEQQPYHGCHSSISISLPPLAVVIFKPQLMIPADD